MMVKNEITYSRIIDELAEVIQSEVENAMGKKTPYDEASTRTQRRARKQAVAVIKYTREHYKPMKKIIKPKKIKSP